MSQQILPNHPLDVVTACRAADLRVLRLTSAALKQQIPFRQLHVITARANFQAFSRTLGQEVALIDEDDFIPSVTLKGIRQLGLPGFPKGAGWYFQQLLKFNFCFVRPEEDHYLIWDADTVPLRSLEFFDRHGTMLFTTADEEHAPYFETYRRLLGEEPRREFSFIAQHMIVRKSILREMLAMIETHLPGPQPWAWKIMRNLQGAGTNLFSEYEMFGHFVKNHYPKLASYRQLPWLRDGSQAVGGVPSSRDLTKLGNDYAFAAFESSQMPFRKWVRWIRSLVARSPNAPELNPSVRRKARERSR